MALMEKDLFLHSVKSLENLLRKNNFFFLHSIPFYNRSHIYFGIPFFFFIALIFVKRWVANKENIICHWRDNYYNNWWFKFQFSTITSNDGEQKKMQREGDKESENRMPLLIIVILPSRWKIYDYILPFWDFGWSERARTIWTRRPIGIHVETFMDFCEHTTNCIL